MAYLSKKTLLEAYKVLSTLSEHPSAQGATQKVSAIRYALALDMFYKRNNRECDTRDSEDKNEFSNNVCFIVALNDRLYTANFYTNIPVHQGDCAVGSNFYSVNAVKNSLTNPTITINYPQRGNNPLFNIKGGKLYQIESYKEDIDFYVSGNNHKFALILWILRNELLDFSNLYASIKRQLQRFFTSTMLTYLLPSEDDFSEFCNQISIESQQDKSIISSNDILALFNETNLIKKTQTTSAGLFEMSTYDKYLPYLTALRTKPFMLLAGISGTGKSRIVRKLAQATNPKTYANEDDRWKDNRPENFELIQVKPNWHNSMDVVGYMSNIPAPHYVFTDFVRFIVKAWQHKDTPYFLCLDEMNLAPVEEYFAEFLSAIESRALDEKDEYITDPIIAPFKEFAQDVREDMLRQLLGEAHHTAANPLVVQFTEKGLTLPPNLMVMGTVNMDETTFSFSRKVLDRAMSIEMNEVNYDDFKEGKTELMPLLTEQNELLVNRPQKACEVQNKIDGDRVINYLKAVNALLEGTPFKLGYRAANEAMLYVSACQDFAGDDFRIEKALDEFTLMKILSRIEGDDSRLSVDERDERLLAAGIDSNAIEDGEQSLNLLNCLRAIVKKHIGQDTETEKKINRMYHTLMREHFVSYWG